MLKSKHFGQNIYEEKFFCVVPDAIGGGAATNSSDVVINTSSNQQQRTIRTERTLQTQYHEECNIFSIGSNNDQWGFENEVVNKLPDCVIRIHLIVH